jgi:hypothetical protein
MGLGSTPDISEVNVRRLIFFRLCDEVRLCLREVGTPELCFNKRAEFYTVREVRTGGTRKRSWLRHYATSRKVAGSILDESIGFFN